jgi:hypothetical protein
MYKALVISKRAIDLQPVLAKLKKMIPESLSRQLMNMLVEN